MKVIHVYIILYRYLTAKDHCFLSVMLAQRRVKAKIGEILEGSTSAIYREIMHDSCAH